MAIIDLKPIKTVRSSFQGIKDNISKIQFTRKQLNNMYAKINGLLELQAMVVDDIITLKESATAYRGNEYQTYDEAVEEIARKYEGTADWGVLQTGNIIDVRAAFIIAQGINIIKNNEDADPEYEFAEDFLTHNRLNQEAAQEFSKEAEIEGKLLLKLDMDKGNSMVTARFVSYSAKKYTITADPSDYLKYKQATWQKTKEKYKTDKKVTLEESNFVYRKFGGRINKPNDATPKVMKCLTQIEYIDKALRDWREINHLYASPVPHVECEDAKQAAAVQEKIDKINWKIRKLFVHTGKLLYLSPDIAGIEGLEKEIAALAKMISGTTGVPIHFLGMTDLLKQVATAKNLMEFIQASTSKEREIWKSAYEEAINKAILLFNEKGESTKYKRKLDPEKVSVEIQVFTKEQFEQVEKVWLPSYIAGAITLDLYLSKLPGVDVAEEKSRREKKDEDELKNIKDELEKTKDELKKKTDEEAARQPGSQPPAETVIT